MGHNRAYRVPQGRLAEVETGIVKMVTRILYSKSLQRGLLLYTLYTFCTAGSIMSYPTYIRCYESRADAETQEQVWLYSEWISTIPGAIRFYIREDRASLALLADSTLKRKPHLDYIA